MKFSLFVLAIELHYMYITINTLWILIIKFSISMLFMSINYTYNQNCRNETTNVKLSSIVIYTLSMQYITIIP